ncbi:MAG: HAD family hydrolase [Dehalococcoidales bacterium]|nr:MAG: HAD family hydrolase [Dehalococcoidales bacterium]
MNYETVIFDLFGTLVNDLAGPEYEVILGQMASVLRVSYRDFRQLWSDTYYERNTGGFNSIEDNVAYICKEFGVQAEQDDTKRTAQIRHDFKRSVMLKPRTDVLEVLSNLKSQDLKIGLVSNCTPAAPVIWPDTPLASLFDVTVFSSSVGILKPDPRIYLLATERLGVQPEDCLYVGNGGSQELAGAAKVGMTSVLIRVPGKYSVVREEWNGPTIASLTELLALVE